MAACRARPGRRPSICTPWHNATRQQQPLQLLLAMACLRQQEGLVRGLVWPNNVRQT